MKHNSRKYLLSFLLIFSVNCSITRKEPQCIKIFQWELPVAFQPSEKRKAPCQPIYYGMGGGDGVLDKSCSELQEKLIEAAGTNDIQRMRQLLREGANASAMSGDFYSPLEQAASNGHLNAALLLLNNGANVNYFHWIRGSALSNATYAGHTEIVELLLSRGANPTIELDGGNALEVAKKLNKNDLVTLIKKYWTAKNKETN